MVDEEIVMGKVIPGVNDLATLYPEIARQWHPTLNGDLTPDRVAAHCNTKHHWLCEKGHDYGASPGKRVSGTGCPYCSNKRVLKGFNDLQTVYPELAVEWDYDLNVGGPEDYVFGSTYRAHWICAGCGRRWEAKICDRAASKHKTCAKCASKKRGKAFHERALKKSGCITDPLLLKEWDYETNAKDPEWYTPKNNKSVSWICSVCGGRYKAAIYHRTTTGQGCPYCSNKRVLKGFNDLKTTYPELASEWDYEANDKDPEDYTYGSTETAHWVCSVCGNKWEAKIRDRVKSKCKTCPECTKKKRGESKHEHALKNSGCITDPLLLKEWDYEKNEKGPESYTPKSNESVFWICSMCGHRYPAKISNRAIGRGCPCCAGNVVVPGINDLATTHPQLAAEWHPTKNGDLKPTDVTYGRADVIWWLCPEGHAYQASLNHRSSGTNCPKCNSGRQTSFAEQAFFYYIRKVFPDAVNRYADIFDGSMELDIYIPSIKLGIEYDGEAWHRKDKKEREARKYRICQEHGIRLLRLKEKRSDSDWGTADEFLSIENGPLYEHEYLARTIRFLLDRIHPESNMWTRKNPLQSHSRVDINIDRDEAEIRSYMTKIKGSLAEKFPCIAVEWHPTKNGSLTPDKVKPHSGARVWWVCPDCGNEYRTTVSSRASGTGCRKCGIRKSALSRGKRVAMLDSDTGEELRVFDTISEASRELGINNSNITMVCKGRRRIAGGYGWVYKDPSESPLSAL